MIRFLVLFCLIPFYSSAYTIDGTRVIIDENNNRTKVVLRNSKDEDVNIQVWMDNYPESGFSSKESFENYKLSHKGLVISPSIFKIPANSSKSIYVQRTSSINLPKNKESIFSFNLRSLPNEIEGNANVMFVAQQVLLKAIFRPKEITESRDSAESRLTYKCSDNKLIINNKTPFIYSPVNISVGNKDFEYTKLITNGENLTTIKCGGHVTLTALNDFGFELDYDLEEE